ncbi:helix-turn-helix domain-containing protein [Clostridium luticellarii]|uniref:Helix-turn-helix protein n=1 Tax=Clostridium luticellarii TaxID=1691940 RepID=A0A2T0BQ56_9CLOT|nr:helix-turn-helix transcriptional regulator [Clostridium luticellarii]PRR86008.1 helix-turn-helix protein [Clostridium luticellarii]
MNISEATAKRIIELCNDKHISINKLASLSGITQSTVNSIVNGGSKNPQLKTILKICYGIEIPLYEFFKSPVFQNIDIDI